VRDADVLIAGLGPVGQLLANLLGSRGVRVLAVDPAARPSGLPRAATADDEVLRILQSAGLDAAVGAHMLPQPRVSFVGAGGRRMTLLETDGPQPNGHPALVAWHQPGVERVLSAGLGRFASVQARWGAGVQALEPLAGGGVRATLDDGERVTASWVVGCDGAGSAVRRLAGIGFEGSSFAQPWLVVDAEVDADAPGLEDHVHFVGDPRRPGVALPMAPGRHRWEWMTSAREDHAALTAAMTARIDGRIARATVYEFHARTAGAWRAGRILLAGDAAHVMPPFAGQGLGAGMRDAANLAWKLDAVLRGAPEALLDTYEAERRPDVRAATRVAVAWGGVLQTRRPRLARARDTVLFTLDATPAGGWLRGRARPAPRYRKGAVLRPLRSGAGLLFPQPLVTGASGRRVRLDEVLGHGWAVLGTLTPGERAAWERAGARIPVLQDPDGVIGAWLGRHRADWVALRPDRHVFACGRAGEAGAAAAAAAAWLGR
jgi:3-(3-hydroxy-phenyl)propionate hydroxylase